MTGPLLRFQDLTPEERDLISADYLRRASDGGLPGASLYLDVMNSWGVMCPHPMESRMYSASWFMCEVCNCAVVDGGTSCQSAPS